MARGRQHPHAIITGCASGSLPKVTLPSCIASKLGGLPTRLARVGRGLPAVDSSLSRRRVRVLRRWRSVRIRLRRPERGWDYAGVTRAARERAGERGHLFIPTWRSPRAAAGAARPSARHRTAGARAPAGLHPKRAGFGSGLAPFWERVGFKAEYAFEYVPGIASVKMARTSDRADAPSGIIGLTILFWRISPWRPPTSRRPRVSWTRPFPYRRNPVPADSPVDVVWLDIGHGQEMHVFQVEGFEVSPFEGIWPARRAVHPGARFRRAQAAADRGARLIEPLRATPFERFFFASR